MGTFTRLFLGSTVLAGAASAYVTKYYIYVGDYHETPPFNSASLPWHKKLKYQLLGSSDDVAGTLGSKLVNPGKNVPIYDYFEKELDPATSRKILDKYKTNEEILGAMQKALFLGPTLWPHRFVISKYLGSKSPSNDRISGYTPIEPALKQFDLSTATEKAYGSPFALLPHSSKYPYIWDKDDIVKHNKPFGIGSIIFGMFTFADSGTRSDGGYFNFLFGSDVFPVTMLHRIEYFTKKNPLGDPTLVFRLTNVSQFTAPGSPLFVDDTDGLHEFMTRTMVLDMVRGIDV